MLSQADRLLPRLVQIRRDLHRRPELSFQERDTARYIADVLASLGIQARMGVAKTGLVVEIGSGTPVVALRADMDALPIQEENQVPYASEVPGVMHACGHDIHMAALLGAAMLLNEAAFEGTVRLLFQPSEEGQDDEHKSGAMRMVEEGVLEGVQAIFSMHVDDMSYVGTAGIRSGPVMAAADSFGIVVKGRGSHGAYPHRGVDPIVLAANVITALNEIVSRRISPQQSGVVTVGSVHGGTKGNIIPDEVELKGTIRSFDPDVRQSLFNGVEQGCEVARALGGDYELSILEGFPPTVNDPGLTELTRTVGRRLLGDQFGDQPVEMGAEDFSYYTQEVPGAYLRLGVRTRGGPVRVIHSSRFDADEACLPVGAALFASLALEYLESRRSGDR